MHLSVTYLIVPFQVIDVVNTLQVHGNALQTVGQLYRYGIQLNAARHLEISKLGNFHTVQPNLPAQAGGPQCRGFPVIFDKTNIMIQRIDSQCLHALQI